MAIRAIDINLISARDLNDVNLFFKIKAYAVAWIEGSESYEEKKTRLDKKNGTNPTWNHPCKFMVDEVALLQGVLMLDVKIRTVGIFCGQEIGRVSVPLKQFVNPAEDGGLQIVAVERKNCEVIKPSGKPMGMLNFSVKIGQRTDASNIQQPASAMDYSQQTTQEGNEPVATSSNPPPHESSPPPPPPPPYPQHYQGYPPQGYPSQGYPQLYQGYPKKKLGIAMLEILQDVDLADRLIQDIIDFPLSYDGGFDDGGGF